MICGLGNATTFLAFFLAGKPLLAALPVYLAVASLGALGMIAGHAVIQTRLGALARTERLEDLAYHDALTGTFNRRRFDDDLGQPDRPAYLLLLDLDHFKRVNDTYGHDMGDQVLRVTARVLKEAVRSTDEVYRLGGEEFAILLATCAPGAAEMVADRVRAQVEQQVARQAGLPGPITVSGGLAPVQGEKRGTLRQADGLLYTAKASGRNRIVADLAGPLYSPA